MIYLLLCIHAINGTSGQETVKTQLHVSIYGTYGWGQKLL